MLKIAIIYHSETGNTEKAAKLVREGCEKGGDVEVRLMRQDAVDIDFLKESKAVIFGSPTYYGAVSWQMKKLLDDQSLPLTGKLGGVFVTQNWPGGGGGSFAEMSMIAGMLIHGMVIYAGGSEYGYPMVHFGAVARKAPEGLDAERAVKLGENLATKAKELFGT